jgi:hypothetical protein
MIVLAGLSILNVLLGVLSVSLAGLVLFIAYRKLLAYVGKGQPVKADYCVLYSLEDVPARGEIAIYFTSAQKKWCKIELLKEDLTPIRLIKEFECNDAGNIVRFNTLELQNGIYFYCLTTENQKTMKKMEVRNEDN